MSISVEPIEVKLPKGMCPKQTFSKLKEIAKNSGVSKDVLKLNPIPVPKNVKPEERRYYISVSRSVAASISAAAVMAAMGLEKMPW